MYRSVGQYKPLFSVENNTKVALPIEMKKQTFAKSETLQISGVVKQAPFITNDRYTFILESKVNNRTIKMQVYLGDRHLFNRIGLNQAPEMQLQSFSKWESADIDKVASLIKKGDQVIVVLPLKVLSVSECTGLCQSRKFKLQEYTAINQRFFNNSTSFITSLVTTEVGPVSQITIGSNQ